MELMSLYTQCDHWSDIYDVIYARKFEISPCHVNIRRVDIKLWSVHSKVQKSNSDTYINEWLHGLMN